MRNKSVILLLVSAMLVIFAQPMYAANDIVQFPIGQNYYVKEGQKVPMDGASFVRDGRTLVPLRYLGDALGAEVKWDEATQMVSLKKDGYEMKFKLGRYQYGINMLVKEMDVTPILKDGRVCLPAKYAANEFGFNVTFDASNNAVALTKGYDVYAITPKPPVENPVAVPGWKEISDSDFYYSISFPSQPETILVVPPMVYRAYSGPVAHYFRTFGNKQKDYYSLEAIPLATSKTLEEVQRDYLKQHNLELDPIFYNKDSKFGNVPAKDMIMQSTYTTSQIVRTKLAIKNNVLYVAMLNCISPDRAISNDAEKFFNSLRFVK